jgi:hypothetical protein
MLLDHQNRELPLLTSCVFSETFDFPWPYLNSMIALDYEAMGLTPLSQHVREEHQSF